MKAHKDTVQKIDKQIEQTKRRITRKVKYSEELLLTEQRVQKDFPFLEEEIEQ